MSARHRASTGRLDRRRLATSGALLALAIGLVQPAAAQQTTTDSAAPSEPIVVTGSRIVNSGAEAPTPLTVLSAEDIQNQSPTNNIADFVNQIPALAGSTRPANSRLAISSGLAGINALNLRALGEIRTLVLLDGRRSVGSTVTGLVDVNTFPQQLVERVEVVTGGASAAYGSDAVAGVVNFVLDKDFTGLRASVDSGMTTRGDGQNYSLQVSAGVPFADGRGHLLLSGEYAHRDGIFSVNPRDREWNFGGPRYVVNPAYAAGNAQPYFLLEGPAGTNNALPGGIINAQVGGTPNSLRGVYFGGNGVVGRYNYGTQYGTTTVGGDWALADNGQNIGIDADDDRRNIFGRLSFEVAPWATVFAEASYNWQESLFNAGPQLMTTRTLSGSNAYLQQALGAAALAGVTSVTLGTTALDLPYRKNNNRREVQRYAIGAEGTFGAFGNDAVWDIYAQYGETDAHEQLRDIMNTAAMNLAVDAVAGPGGTIVCRSTLTNPGNGCQPLNLLGVGVASQGAIDYVLGDPYRDQELKQTVVGANLSVTPFATWAGDVGIAVGAEYRKEEVSGFVPTEFQTGWSVGNFLPTFGSYNVKEAYLEALVPVGAGIVLNGAVRATDYSTSGYVTTWKAGAVWEPIPDIRLRVTQSRDIRAPNLNELFQSGTSRTNTLTDPFTNRTGVTFRETTTGNLALEPEKADSTVVGAVLQPSFIPGLSLSVDWFQIKVKDSIGQFFAQDIINRCFEGFTSFCAGYGPDPTGERELFFRASPFNFSRVITRGVDFDLAYALPLDELFAGNDATLRLRGLVTRYIDNVVDDGITQPIDTVGSLAGAGPSKWIYRAAVTYDSPSWSLAGVVRGVGDGTYSNAYIACDAGSCPAYTTVRPTAVSNDVEGATYVDLNFTARVADTRLGEAEAFVQFTNLFDADPIVLPESGLAANSTYSDLLGRSFRVGVRIELD
ncbi:TonB-dependent receptor [Croceibacterium sp. TMG7-5b_MA50]|uniref:TonB-dependent receptor plug domain-containing protein n=1 Tax=Croceibacterium sp. TMG7-5b_MA50 TaxID=3121290 RepID=UPI00322171E3